MGAQADPAVAFTTDSGVAIARPAGEVIVRIDDVNIFSYSLDSDLFAYYHRIPDEKSPILEEMFGHNALTGARRFQIDNATSPILVDHGRKVFFLPDNDGQRDPQVNSVWLREEPGTIRKIVQFSNGPGLPGVSLTDLGNEAGMMEVVFDAQGATMAVTEGNDEVYDVWVVQVQTGAARRVTTGRRSQHPSLTPDGRRLAVAREHTECPSGMRASDIQTMGTDGANLQTLKRGTCAVFYTDPKWVSADRLLATRFTERPAGSGDYRRDLVAIDVPSGQVSVVAELGDLVFFTCSPSRQEVAYVRERDESGFSLLNLQTGETTRFNDVINPNVASNPEKVLF
jgi:dipeptidyl aminopeptidase/acylaminoacyl peptidase